LKNIFSIFRENFYSIESIQENDKDAEYNINHLADLSQEKFVQKYLMQDLNLANSVSKNKQN